MRLENKIAIVTGGTRGIGYEVSKAFIKEGAKVVVCGSTDENALKACQNLSIEIPEAKTLAVGVDMTNYESIQKMIEHVMENYGRIDILVNNAGITQTQSIMEAAEEDIKKMMDINFMGTYHCIKEASKYMKETGGSIINTSSMVGIYGGNHQSAYASSKFAVNGLTKSCAKELGRFQIRVNAVAPGVVETDMMKNAVSEEMKQGLIQMIPLGRCANPSELAGIYVYLASDESSYTTGSIISVDGGLVM